MKRARWILPPAMVVTVAILLAALAQAHRGYPRVVYFYRYEEVPPTTQANLRFVNDTWVDPGLRAVRVSAHNFEDSRELRVDEIVRGGSVYDLDAPRDSRMQQLPLAQAKRYGWIEQQLQRGGFSGLTQDLLAHALGRITHSILYGMPALRFSAITPYSPDAPGIVWLDARTHVLLQIQWSIGVVSHTERFVQQRLLAAGAVPDDFFDPIPSSHSFLDQLLDWLPGRSS
jgi:hypothetical protein